jgi:hypothetical protein
MRPAYWRYVGDCDGNNSAYVGGADQMVLGYGTAARGRVWDQRLQAQQNLNPTHFYGPARQALDQSNISNHSNVSKAFSVTSNSFAK